MRHLANPMQYKFHYHVMQSSKDRQSVGTTENQSAKMTMVKKKLHKN